MSRSPIKWMGGKAKLAEEIVKLFPKQFNTYYEPFFGSGAVFFQLKPESSRCSDLMAEPIIIMNAIKQDPKSLYVFFEKMSDKLWEEGESCYYQIREHYNQNKDSMTDVERGATFLFLLRAGFNGVIRFNAKKNNAWNVPYGRRGCKTNKNVKLHNKYFLSELLEHSAFLNSGNKQFAVEDFRASISQVSKNDIIYCDPPYTKTSSDKRYNMTWGEDQDVALRKALGSAASRGAHFVLSNILEYKGENNDALLSLYAGFEYKTIEHQYIVGPKSKMRQRVKEILIYN